MSLQYQVEFYITILTDTETRELCLDECPGIDQQDGFDLLPIAHALKRNTYFHSLIIKNVPRKEAVQKFSITIQKNTVLQSIKFSGLESEEGFVELGAALRVQLIDVKN